MKIALVALPSQHESLLEPPLSLAYLAALLEQQRHIVRIYDLALAHPTSLAETIAALATFRPRIVVTDDLEAPRAVEAALEEHRGMVVRLGIGPRDSAPGPAVARALWQIDRAVGAGDERSVIFSALLALDGDLDALPFPARHLLPLEQYPLKTPTGELQTTVLVGQRFADDAPLRAPAQIIAELRSVVREHGIRHVILSGMPLTHDLIWLRDLLASLAVSDLGVAWEGGMQYQRVTPDLLRRCRQAGCESICLTLDATEVLGSASARALLASVVQQAREHEVYVRAHVQFDPAYSRLPELVDLSATFGFEDVRFTYCRRSDVPAYPRANQPIADVTAIARAFERVSRSRQRFVTQFGERLGPLLWRLGRAGALGRAWQRYAEGSGGDGRLSAKEYRRL